MNAKQAYSDDDRYSPDRYSDDFESDDGKRTSTPKRTSTLRKVLNHQYYQDKFRGRGRGSGSMRGRGLGRGMKRGRGNSQTSEPADIRKSHDSVTARVLSASRNRVNALRNKVEELSIQIRDLQQENKLYKKMQFRQEKAIRVFDDKENDLPSILDRHNNEVRALREQNRRLKEKYDKTDRYLRDAEDELERVKKKMNKYKEICEQKELKERDELSRKLAQAELDLEDKETKLKELQRYIEMLKKNHKRELGIEVARQKEMKKQVEDLLEKNSQLENQLKEKEKALDYFNIYSNPQQGRPSRDSSPNGSFTMNSKKKVSATSELTPRDKAKFYAEKRRAELLKQKEVKEEKEQKKREQWEKEEKDREKNAINSPPEFVFGSKDRGFEDKEELGRREGEKQQRKDNENIEKQEEELQRKQRVLEKRQEQERLDEILREKKERKEQEENERREQEEWENRKRKEREESERREQEWEKRKRKEQEENERDEQREREERELKEHERKLDRERKEKLEQERREKEAAEQERRLQLERTKLDNDPLMQADRKKKDDLLKKLQEMDKLGSSGTDPFTPASPSRKSKEHSRTDGIRDTSDSTSRRTEPKEYSFTKPINNLHQGKPAHEDVTVPYLERQKHRRRTSDDAGGYQPSFGPTRGEINKASSTKPKSIFDDNDDDDEPIFKVTNRTSSESTTKKDKKTNLLENLFGPQASESKNTSKNDPFISKNISSSSNNQTRTAEKTYSTALPWDTNSDSTLTNKTRLDPDKKSTIFGGGALIEDDFSGNSGKVLPRRHRQHNVNTFSAKPSVTAIDTFDDEIEEFVL